MKYVVYDKESTVFINGMKTGGYATKGAAKAALNRIAKTDVTDYDILENYAIAESIDFHNNIEKMVTRVNLMSKKEFEERANTPIYCSPAFESYWSM